MKRHLLPGTILAACIIRLWVMPLGSSFWTDEIGTAFLIKYGASHPSFEVVRQFPMSIYYRLPQAADAVFGFSEAAYRLPSLLAMLAALYVLWRLAARLIRPEAAWLTVFAAIALPGFTFQAADARPYGLGTLVTLAALWFLIAWLDSGRRRDALLFVLLAALVWRVHLIFWPLYIVFGVYAAARLALRDTRVTWRQAALYFALLGIALLPVLRDVLTLLPEASAHSISEPPSASDVIVFSGSWLLLLLGFGALLYGALASKSHASIPAASWVLVLACWLIHPLALATYSHVTEVSVFVDRYVSVSLAGTALAAAALMTLFLPLRAVKPAACLLGFAALLVFGQWGVLWPSHSGQGWREAAQAVTEYVGDSSIPVIFPSPYFEAQPPTWRPDYPLESFIYAPLSVYPMSGTVYPFPYRTSPEAERWADEFSRNVLTKEGRFLIFGPVNKVEFWRRRFSRQPDLAEWTNRSLGPFGTDDVVVFQTGP